MRVNPLVAVSAVCLLFGLTAQVNAVSLYWESDFGTWSNLSDEDDDYEEVYIGFDFTFYGTSHESLWINSNGALHFDGDIEEDLYDYQVGEDFESNYGPTIAPFWADLYPPYDGDIYYNTLGSGSDQRFVVTWDDVVDYEDEDYYNTFQSSSSCKRFDPVWLR